MLYVAKFVHLILRSLTTSEYRLKTRNWQKSLLYVIRGMIQIFLAYMQICEILQFTFLVIVALLLKLRVIVTFVC